MKTAQQRLNEFLGATPEELEEKRRRRGEGWDYWPELEILQSRHGYGTRTRRAFRAHHHYLVLKYQVWEENEPARRAAYEAAPKAWIKGDDGVFRWQCKNPFDEFEYRYREQPPSGSFSRRRRSSLTPAPRVA